MNCRLQFICTSLPFMILWYTLAHIFHNNSAVLVTIQLPLSGMKPLLFFLHHSSQVLAAVGMQFSVQSCCSGGPSVLSTVPDTAVTSGFLFV